MKTEFKGFFLPRLVRFFDENTLQASGRRSRAGLLIAAILLPLLLSVLACMPVPVGDPEKSRVDSDISGVWLADLDEDSPLLVFDPYDKRTWLVSWFDLEEKTPLDSELNDGTNEEDQSDLSAIEALQKNQYATDGFIMFKGWLTRIKEERFLTLEPKTFEPGVTPEHWFVFRIRLVGVHQLQLLAVSHEFKGLKGVKTSAEAEEIISLNLENPDLFGDPLIYQKVSPDDLETVNQLIEEFLEPDSAN